MADKDHTQRQQLELEVATLRARIDELDAEAAERRQTEEKLRTSEGRHKALARDSEQKTRAWPASSPSPTNFRPCGRK